MALSSGRTPSAIAIVRISGPAAHNVAAAFGAMPLEPRRAALRTLHSPVDGSLLDRALCLAFDGPASATGEDVVEFHCHGSPALVDRILADVTALDGVRMAEPGEFSLRAVLAGRMDLTAAEGLADLIEARTEGERRRATRLADGELTRTVARWRAMLIGLAAGVEADIDFADEADVAEHVDAGFAAAADALRVEIAAALEASLTAGTLTDGFHIALVGPPNCGKSSLLNALTGTDAAIVTDEAGTTRDVVSVPLELGGYRVTLHDTAGVREGATGVEAIGIGRAAAMAASADLVVSVASPDTVRLPINGLLVLHKADLGGVGEVEALRTSLFDPASLDRLRDALAAAALPVLTMAENAPVTRARQRAALSDVSAALQRAAARDRIELRATELRDALDAMARLTGEIGIEHVLDDVFGRFCIGK